MKSWMLLAILLVSGIAVPAQKTDPYLLIGTYTSGKSEGIYVYQFNTRTGESRYVSQVATENPSFLAVSPDRKFVYAVNEGRNEKGNVTAFSFDPKTGQLKELNRQHSGDDPCYVAIDNTGRWVFTGNYTSGSLDVFPVQGDGSLGPAATTIRHEGGSVNTERQEGPHVHATVLSPDNHFLFVPDLGMDKLMIYAFDPATGSLRPAATPFVATEPGSGPRHFTFHPNHRYAYLIEELTGTISAYYYDGKGGLRLLQNISAQPFDYMGPSGSAEIMVSPDGRFLYASNRGESNTVATFAINRKTGGLTPLAHDSTMGKAPRNFNFDPTGNFLLVANQESDNIVIFKRDKSTGLLADTGKRIDVGKPVCIVWIATK